MIENGKIVHFCWFGKEKMPQRYVDFLENNKKFFPGYQFIVWTEDNFDIYSCDYAAQAYDKGKYAFVSDYVRMKVLYEYGGIYLDLDVEFLKKFSDIEAGKEFMGFERRKYLGTAVISLKKHSIIAKKMLIIMKIIRFFQKMELWIPWQMCHFLLKLWWKRDLC